MFWDLKDYFDKARLQLCKFRVSTNSKIGWRIVYSFHHLSPTQLVVSKTHNFFLSMLGPPTGSHPHNTKLCLTYSTIRQVNLKHSQGSWEGGTGVGEGRVKCFTKQNKTKVSILNLLVSNRDFVFREYGDLFCEPSRLCLFKPERKS